jgi:hypothetical protein
MLAAQLRQEAGRNAHDNALLKRRTTITGGINSLITAPLNTMPVRAERGQVRAAGYPLHCADSASS